MLSIVRMSLCVLLLVLPSLVLAQWLPPTPVTVGVRWLNIGTAWPGWITMAFTERPMWPGYSRDHGTTQAERRPWRETVATLEYRIVFDNKAIFGVQVGTQPASTDHWYCGWGNNISLWARYGPRKANNFYHLGCVDGPDDSTDIAVDIKVTPGTNPNGSRYIRVQHTGYSWEGEPDIRIPFNWGTKATKVVLQGAFNRDGHPFHGTMLFNTPPPRRGIPYNHSETYTVDYPTASDDFVIIHGDFVMPPAS